MQYGKIETATMEEFAEKGADVFALQIRHVIQEKGQCMLGLSGGATPRPIYELLAREPLIDWSQVNVFLTDERYVPVEDAESNQGMIRATLLEFIDIPETNIVFPDTTLPLAQCVDDYNARLEELLGNEPPDIATFGIGKDGHIASLFPPLNDVMLSRDRYVVGTQTDLFVVKDRLTMTLPILKSSKVALFAFHGKEKRDVWDQMIHDKQDHRRWPAQAVLSEGRAIAIIG